MKKIAVLNIKGGAAKTATVTSVAHMLATQYNKRVLIVDLDPQGNTTGRFSNINIYDRLQRKLDGKIEAIDNSISNLLMNPEMDVHQCIRHTVYENLDIIPSDLQLGDVQDRIKADVTTPAQFRLKKHIRKIEDEYDYCIMDCSPSVSIANVNGLAVCDEVYIPTTIDGDSLEGVAYALELIRNVTEYNESLKIAGCFFTRWDERQKAPKVAYELLEEMIPGLILPFHMYKTTLIDEGSYTNTPLLEADRNKRLNKTTISYLHLSEYIMADDKEAFLKKYNSENRTFLTIGQFTDDSKDVKDEVLRKLKTEGVMEPLEVKEEGSSYKIVKGGEIFDGIVKLNKEKMWDRYRPIPVKVVG